MRFVKTLFTLLVGCSITQGAEDFLRRPDTVVSYFLDGSEIQLDHPSNPATFLGAGGWSNHREGQGPQIGLESGAQFLFSGLTMIQSIHFQGSTAQSTQSQTNNGVSTFLQIQHLNPDSIWETFYFLKPYEHNFNDGPQNASYAWDLVLDDLPELSGGSFGIRFLLGSRGYANSPPGQPYVSVDTHLLDAQVLAVPEVPSAMFIGISILITFGILMGRHRRTSP
jgi:hypothetical protein